ncbi:regulatory protein RecX [Piscirickettsia litoralis]|uniref:Regulatory protein RecX n=1 Tax=Piscirickettsia litoralis TaxID=1891921 RepID=A0ABX3A2V9_9GAMM|nr:regulatory protein RecX [Piscirickettsia litoralis]ODN41785.1 RecX family transcriptional regulator [Piscirickettsia litoralis]
MLHKPLSDESSIRVAAIRFLARREYSYHELYERLKPRVQSYALLESVLLSLQEQDLISDQRFCESYVRSKVNSGQGPLKIKQALFHKGVAEVIICSVLADYSERWYDNAFRVWCKRFDHPGETPEDQARQIRFLQSRGFEFEHIQAALKQGRQQVSEE